MSANVYKDPEQKALVQLKRRRHQEWKAVIRDILSNLMNSMPGQTWDVIKMKGNTALVQF